MYINFSKKYDTINLPRKKRCYFKLHQNYYFTIGILNYPFYY